MTKSTRFYFNFHTDLPDQFIEANSQTLQDWCGGWIGCSIRNQVRYFQGNPVSMIDNKRDEFPILTANQLDIHQWMMINGALYNGRYWTTLAPHQRSADEASRHARGGVASGTITRISMPVWRSINSIKGPGPSLIALAQHAMNQQIAGVLYFSSDFTNDSPRPALRRKMQLGEIVGYRCWRVDMGAGNAAMLRSVYQPDSWIPNEPLTGRGLGDWNQRGIHAWKDLNGVEFQDYVRSYLYNHIPYGDSPMALATGTIHMWGDVVEHTLGYRAEYASVRSIDWLYPTGPMVGREASILSDLQFLYGVHPCQQPSLPVPLRPTR